MPPSSTSRHISTSPRKWTKSHRPSAVAATATLWLCQEQGGAVAGNVLPFIWPGASKLSGSATVTDPRFAMGRIRCCLIADNQNCFNTTDRVATWCMNWACKFGCLIDAKQYHTKYKNSWCEGFGRGVCHCQFCD
ncbi:uncharacterized protein [Zea mays]|uniref:uncharacterized protein isoform X2 n=1 Tax=Zea mays TaxID=4577 RepID=UPI0009AAB1B4|nr:uncharacterized protein LOC109940892 isoform X2 [Zea mays]|eukprot:XP_020396836.1 uncharacterized protein LOC109940892 isoform X2 [Zea mays]